LQGSYLGTRTSSSKQGARDAASESGGNARITEAVESLDSGNRNLLLAETGLGVSQEKSESCDLGDGHFDFDFKKEDGGDRYASGVYQVKEDERESLRGSSRRNGRLAVLKSSKKV
jgi:hypothetical protein